MRSRAHLDPSLAGPLVAKPEYHPGAHIIVDATGVEESGLSDPSGFRAMIEAAISELGLVSVGSVHHAFPGGGFTAVVCLTESHLSIHTWPEHGRATFDVFLSNFSRSNDAAAEALVARISSFLGAGTFSRQTLRR